MGDQCGFHDALLKRVSDLERDLAVAVSDSKHARQEAQDMKENMLTLTATVASLEKTITRWGIIFGVASGAFGLLITFKDPILRLLHLGV
jgi:hypothetical protein